jgi:peptidyl-tRNA hydrolase, PTH1 family
VGLGNPGAEFVGTRHNVGAEAVGVLAGRHGADNLRLHRAQRARVGEIRVDGRRLALAVPTTYMNDSGNAVGALVRRFGIEDPRTLVIIHDELDLEPGRTQVKAGGGLAGHNGLRSIAAQLETDDFVRIRIGIGKPPPGLGANYVLSRPSKQDRAALDAAVAAAADAAEVIATEGVGPAMSQFNGRVGGGG